MLCGSYRNEIVAELRWNSVILEVSSAIQNVKKKARKDFLHKTLQSLTDKNKFDDPFITPLDNRMEIKNFVIPKCNAMSSKKVPLWLNCKNAVEEAENILIMFKVGDDLR